MIKLEVNKESKKDRNKVKKKEGYTFRKLLSINKL